MSAAKHVALVNMGLDRVTYTPGDLTGPQILADAAGSPATLYEVTGDGSYQKIGEVLPTSRALATSRPRARA